MKFDDRVFWQYTHQNGRSRFQRVKEGSFKGTARHTSKHWRHYSSVQMAWVHFDHNKNWSKVPLEDLRPAPKESVDAG